MPHQGNVAVRTDADRGEISLPRRFYQRRLHFRRVGEAVHDDVQARVAKVGSQPFGHALNTEVSLVLVSLVVPDIRGDVLPGIIRRIERIDLLELQFSAIRQNHRLVQLSALEQLGEDSERRWPAPEADTRSCLCQRLGYCKPEPPVVGDPCYQGTLSGQVDWQHLWNPCSMVVAGM